MDPVEDVRFNETIFEAVNEGLLALGESVRHAIYYYIAKIYQIKCEEIPDRIAEFHEALRGLFGAGAEALERLIAKKLYEKLDLSFEEHENWTFVEYVENAKKATEGS